MMMILEELYWFRNHDRKMGYQNIFLSFRLCLAVPEHFSLSLSFCLSLSTCLPDCLFVSACLYLSVYVSLSVPPACLRPSVHLSSCVSVSVCLCLAACLSPSLCLSHRLCLSVCVPACPSVSLFVCFSWFRSTSVFILRFAGYLFSLVLQCSVAALVTKQITETHHSLGHPH